MRLISKVDVFLLIVDLLVQLIVIPNQSLLSKRIYTRIKVNMGHKSLTVWFSIAWLRLLEFDIQLLPLLI